MDPNTEIEAMTLHEKLKIAARVLGWRFQSDRTGNVWVNKDGYLACPCNNWNPDTDDGASRSLEIECLNWLSVNYLTVTGECEAAEIAYNKMRKNKNIDPEQYRTVVLDLAVAIGRTINAD